MRLLVFFLFFVSNLCSLPEKIAETVSGPHPILKQRIEKWIASIDKNKKSYASLKKLGAISLTCLFEALEQNYSTSAKRQLVKLIGHWQSTNSEKRLILLLKKERLDTKIKEEICLALEKIGTDKALSTLYDLGKNNLFSAAKALCAINTSKKIPYMIKLLQHWNNQVRDIAHQTLKDETKQEFTASYDIWKKWWENFSSENN